jgi:hypothetical protein
VYDKPVSRPLADSSYVRGGSVLLYHADKFLACAMFIAAGFDAWQGDPVALG